MGFLGCTNWILKSWRVYETACTYSQIVNNLFYELGEHNDLGASIFIKVGPHIQTSV